MTQQTSPHQSCTHDPTKMGAYWFVSRTGWTAAAHTGTKRNLQAITFPIWAIYKSIRPLVPIFQPLLFFFSFFSSFFFLHRRDWPLFLFPLFLFFSFLSSFLFCAGGTGARWPHARTRAHVGSPGPPFKLNQHLCVNSCRTNTHRMKKKKRKTGGGPSKKEKEQQRSPERSADASSSLLPLQTPPRSISLSLSLSLALSLPPFLNWHRSGSKHDNRKSLPPLRSALSDRPQPRSLETQISQAQRGEKEKRKGGSHSVLSAGAQRGITRDLYTTHTHTHTLTHTPLEAYVLLRIVDLSKVLVLNYSES